MNKGIQIVSLILLFSVCGAVGYFIGGVFDKKELQPDNVVVSEVAKVPVAPDVAEVSVVPEAEVIRSTIPEIKSISSPTKNSDNKTYRLIVKASVESGHKLEYYITKDDKGDDLVATSDDGEFNTLPHSSNGKYHVWVENTETCERYHRVVSGFDPIKVIPNIVPLTAREINESINSTTDGFVPEKISDKFGPKHRVVNDDNDKFLYDDFSVLWNNTFVGCNKYEVVDVTLDDQSNKLVEIRVKVIK